MCMNDTHSPWDMASFDHFEQLAISFHVLDLGTTHDFSM